MKRLTQEALQKVLESEVRGGDTAFPGEYKGLSIDSRTIRPGEIFFAITGPNNDGHDYIEQAFEKGAAAVVVNKSFRDKIAAGSAGVVFPVNDTHEALLNLAAYLRRTSDARFAAVTGSNGKTTTKEMLYQILRRKHSVYRSPGNLNNLFGLPIALGRMPEVDYAVFELGISVPGEMSRLARIVKPELAIITNIGPAHLETLKSIDAITKAKFEMVDHLPVGAAVVLNADDPNLMKEAARRNLNFIGFSLLNDSQFKADKVKLGPGLAVSFEIQGDLITVKSPGRINVYNALAAIAASSVWNCGPDEWRRGLSEFKPVDMRLTFEEHQGLQLLIDCYNANPESTRAALETVAQYKTAGNKIAVMADMLELGSDAPDLHRRLGRQAAQSDLDYLYCFGPQCRYLAEGAREAGFDPKKIACFDDHQELLNDLLGRITRGDLVLFKGSRGMALEKVVVGVRGAAFKGN